jgi:L-alanine-DL-glutamate epimerase-like enolase superfamily enzyme
MIIDRIELRIVTRRYESSFRNPHLTWHEKHALLVFVHAGGIWGVGEAWCDSGAPESVAAYIVSDLVPLAMGQDVSRPAALFARLMATGKMSLRGSALYAAASGVEIAAWDCWAKSLGTPLWRLLGGMRNTLPAYVSGGFYAQGYGPEQLARDMAQGLATGACGVKVKGGLASPAEEAARIAAVRQAIGPDAWLMVDFLFAPTRRQAIAIASGFAGHDLRFLEAPTALDDMEGWRDIRAATGLALAGPEVASGLDRFRAAIETAQVDYVQADAIICGGLAEAMRVGALAAAHHRPFTLHCSGSAVALAANAAIAAAAVTGDSVEMHLLHRTLFDRLGEWGYRLEAGLLHLSEHPGLGIDLEPDDPDLAPRKVPATH